MLKKLFINIAKTYAVDDQYSVFDQWRHESNQRNLSRLMSVFFGFDVVLYFLVTVFGLMKVSEEYFLFFPLIIGILLILLICVNTVYFRAPALIGQLAVGITLISRVVYFIYLDNTTNAYFMLLGSFMMITFLYIGFREIAFTSTLSLMLVATIIGRKQFNDFNDFFLFVLIAFVILGYTVFSKIKYINAVEGFFKMHQMEALNKELNELNKNYEKELETKTQLLQKTKEAETMFRQLTETINSAVLLVNHDDRIVYMNDVLKNALKNSHVKNITELKGYFKPLCYSRVKATYDRVKMGRMAGYVNNINCINYNEKALWMDMKLTPIDMDNAHYILISGVDITEVKEKEMSVMRLSQVKDVILSINHATTRQLSMNDYFKYILEAIMEVLPHAKLGSVLVHNDGMLKIVNAVGYNHEDLLDFELPLSESYMYRQTKGKFTKSEIINNIQLILKPELNMLRENEEHLIVESSICAPIFIDGTFFGFISFESDENFIFDDYDLDILNYIREQVAIAIKNQRLYRKTMTLSKHDQLTGFFNRWYIEELMDTLASQWNRYHENIQFVVMDINYLKSVNDQLGHLVGDMYLKTFAEQVEATFRQSDIFIRMGGDEFVGIIYNISTDDLRDKLEALNQSLLSSTEIEMKNLKLSFSYGISKYGEDGEAFDQLFKVADENMYKYKVEFKS